MSIVPEPGYVFRSGKTYVHSVGLSCCFRQWKAESHCRFLHGYSIKVECHFKAVGGLDIRNWVVDYGSLKSFKGWLEDTFDHKTLVAEDDPMLPYFMQMAGLTNVSNNLPGLREPLIQLRVLPAVGCEAMAYTIHQYLDMWLQSNGYAPRVELEEVKVFEHEANWASYGRDS